MSGKGKRKHGGGGDQNSSKKKSYFCDATHAHNIPTGTRGVLVTTWTGKEVHGGREAMKILEEAYEKLCPEAADAGEQDVGDISALLASEVADLKDKSKNLFDFKTMGISSLTYVIIKYKDGPTPVELVQHVCREVQASKQNKARYCNRFYPVETVCAANKEELQKVAEEIAKTHFPAEEKSTVTFSIEPDKRLTSLDRMEVIDIFAKAVPTPPYNVNLSNPSKSIMVCINKNSCGVSVVENFRELLKFNLKALAGEEETGGPKKVKNEEAKKDEAER